MRGFRLRSFKCSTQSTDEFIVANNPGVYEVLQASRVETFCKGIVGHVSSECCGARFVCGSSKFQTRTEWYILEKTKIKQLKMLKKRLG
ncbi:hypothetical protein V6N13_125815 [Hibiscus sabdariffa]